jgi:hypothetical protein
VARGEAEIGIQQINVILPVTGADYVGPLPAELQGYVDFAVGVPAVSNHRDAAQALVNSCHRPRPRPSSARAAWSRRRAGRRINEDLSGNGEKTCTQPLDVLQARLARILLTDALNAGTYADT